MCPVRQFWLDYHVHIVTTGRDKIGDVDGGPIEVDDVPWRQCCRPWRLN